MDYAIHHDKKAGKYQIFFKGRDADAITAALGEVLSNQVKTVEKSPSILNKMKRILHEMELAPKKVKEQERQHEKSSPER